MAGRKLDADTIKTISLIENLTGATVKDYLPEEGMIIVGHGQMGRVIGKQGSNLKRIEQALRKKFKLVEYSDDPSQFFANLIEPARAESITVEGESLQVKTRDPKTKGKIYGRDRSNLRLLKEIMQRHFPVKDIVLV